MINPVEKLNTLSLADFPRLFAHLQTPDPQSLHGVFQGRFVGPAWLRRLDGPLLALSGLSGWWGKIFDEQGNAINLVRRQGRFLQRFPMLLKEQKSFVDGKLALAWQYAPKNPWAWPWPWIVDELRSLQPGLLLGMTMARLGPLRRLALPFVLQYKQRSPEF